MKKNKDAYLFVLIVGAQHKINKHGGSYGAMAIRFPGKV